MLWCRPFISAEHERRTRRDLMNACRVIRDASKPDSAVPYEQYKTMLVREAPAVAAALLERLEFEEDLAQEAKRVRYVNPSPLEGLLKK